MTLGNNDLIFAKVKKNAIIPTKTDENAGYDVYACFDEDYMIVEMGETRLIPTGIASAINNTKYIQIEERGSVGSKGIKTSCGIIDSGYRGEWFIAITNTNNKDFIISKLSKEELINNYCLVDDEGNSYLLSGNSKIFLKYNDGYETDEILYPYSKAISQAIIHEVHKMYEIELPYQELLVIESARGSGKLGSSMK